MSDYCISCKNRTDAGVAPAAFVLAAAFWHVLTYPVFWGTRPGAFLTVLFIFCAAASEEFLFRGALFALFRDSSGDRPIFASSAYGSVLSFLVSGRALISSAARRVLISAAAFSAAHIFNIASLGAALTALQMAYAFAAGAFLAFLYEKTGRLWIPVIIHTGINTAVYCFGGTAAKTFTLYIDPGTGSMLVPGSESCVPTHDSPSFLIFTCSRHSADGLPVRPLSWPRRC